MAWFPPVRHAVDGDAGHRLALRPIIVERLPAIGKAGRPRKGEAGNRDNVTVSDRGNGVEYLLRRLAPPPKVSFLMVARTPEQDLESGRYFDRFHAVPVGTT